jgi:hypothetical protein
VAFFAVYMSLDIFLQLSIKCGGLNRGRARAGPGGEICLCFQVKGKQILVLSDRYKNKYLSP